MRPPQRASSRNGCSRLLFAAVFGLFCLAFMLVTMMQSGTSPVKDTQVSKPLPSDELAVLSLPSSNPPPTRSPLPAFDLRKIASALEPEIMQNAPPVDSYIQGVKNPCWQSDGGHRCLPYVYLAGSFQSGVNTLLSKLILHGDILTNEMTRWQFWGEEGKRMSEYVKKFGQEFPKIQADPSKKILLDASSSTFAFYWSAALRTHQAFQRVIVAKDLGVEYDSLHVPLLVAAVYGQARLPKMIVLLRNPTDRLHCAYWSHPHYKGKYGESAEGFLAYVKEQIGALRKCEQRGIGARECALYFETYGMEEELLFFHADQIIRGMYSIFLEVWLRFIPRDNILILKSEEYFANPGVALDQVFSFLGLDPPTAEVGKSMEAAGQPTSYTQGKPAMLKEARDLVMEFYRPWNDRLAELLGDEYYRVWNKNPVTRH